MNCEVTQGADGIVRVQLAGRLDTAGVDAVETRFAAAAASGRGPVVVDLGGVEFLASMGIRMLLTTARAAKQRGSKVALHSPRPLVREVLESSGVTTIVPVVADEAEALAAVRA